MRSEKERISLTSDGNYNPKIQLHEYYDIKTEISVEYIGPIFIFSAAFLYLLGCIVSAIILWAIYKFALKIEERPGFGELYKISFSAGLIAGIISYAFYEVAVATSLLGTGVSGVADAAAYSVATQILNYPRFTAAAYMIVILAISALLIYAGFYLAHRYHTKSTPKQIASKVSLIVAAILFAIQGAAFTYIWIAAAKGMEETYGHLSPEEAAAAEAARECAAQMQRALTLPEDQQQAAILEASNCMGEAGGAGPARSALPSQLLASWGDAYGQCMGAAQMGQEDDPSCARLTEIENQLTAQGYCYVTDGPRSNWGWQPCDGGSSQANSQENFEKTINTTNDNCREQGQEFSSALANHCGGVWNIYASIPGGYTWFSSASDRESVRINAQAERKRDELRECGIETYISLSDNFDEFAQDLVVVHSAPHSSSRVAAAELSRANACNLQGYSKQSRFQVKVGH